MEETCVQCFDTILADEDCEEAYIKVPNMSDCFDLLRI